MLYGEIIPAKEKPLESWDIVVGTVTGLGFEYRQRQVICLFSKTSRPVLEFLPGDGPVRKWIWLLTPPGVKVNKSGVIYTGKLLLLASLNVGSYDGMGM